ncbi:MAG TPA: RNA polymerase sigma factor [Cytophagaceae bacterium]|jgi:RNA polymerase sigma-70 factor (ECF subfamily)
MIYEEKAVVKGCLKKDPKSQQALYNQYADLFFGLACRYTRQEMEAEDVLQESFIKIFQNLGQYSGLGSFEGWMKRIVVTTAINYYHKNKKDLSFSAHTYESENVSEHNNIIDQLSTEELLSCLRSLPEGFRLIINLYAIEGYSHKEIAAMLNISEGTSKSQLSRGRKLLEVKMLEKNKIKIL